MNDDRRPILVFGATGRQGGSVAEALLRTRRPVRAIVRSPASPRSALLRDRGIEVVGGSFEDIDAIRTAMRDAYGVFSVLPGNLAQEEEIRLGSMIADLAAESGVDHLVYSSGASAGDKPTGVARFDAKPHIEAHIRGLPITATVVRPMIFMDMLVRPGFGLDEDRFTFFLRPEQSMQLVAVQDIGKFVAAIFADRKRFDGKTLKLASDTVTGRDLETIFTEVSGRRIAYSRFPDRVLDANPDLGQIARSLDHGPLSDHADLDVLSQINPEILSFRSWLAGSGGKALHQVLANRAI
jgi:uncharacterized protein YbjT (DUF2867 family)